MNSICSKLSVRKTARKNKRVVTGENALVIMYIVNAFHTFETIAIRDHLPSKFPPSWLIKPLAEPFWIIPS